MRNAPVALVLLAWMLTLPTAAARADAAGEARKAIRAQYQRINAAIEKQDVDAIARLLTPDFRLTGGGDTVNRAEYKTMVKQGFQTVYDMKASTAIESFTLQGNQAIVVTRQIQSGKARVTNAPQNRAVTVVMKLRDTWAKTPQGWLLRRSEGLSSQSTVDGNKAHPPGHSAAEEDA